MEARSEDCLMVLCSVRTHHALDMPRSGVVLPGLEYVVRSLCLQSNHAHLIQSSTHTLTMTLSLRFAHDETGAGWPLPSQAKNFIRSSAFSSACRAADSAARASSSAFCFRCSDRTSFQRFRVATSVP
jgi:hypothetical protein